MVQFPENTCTYPSLSTCTYSLSTCTPSISCTPLSTDTCIPHSYSTNYLSFSTSNSCTTVDHRFPPQNNILSRQGQTVMQTLDPYLTNFTLELQKFLASQEKENPLEGKLIEEIREMKCILKSVQKEVSSNRKMLDEILVKCSNSVRTFHSFERNSTDNFTPSELQEPFAQEIYDNNPLIATPPQPNLAIKITRKLDFSTPQIKVQDINPLCQIFRENSIAGIIPPKRFDEISYEQKLAIKRQSKSDINFGVNLVRICIPANRRYKMSCSGKSKNDLGHFKEPFPSELITRVLDCSREMWGHVHSPKEFVEAIDSDCRHLFSKAKEWRIKKSCPVCRQDSVLSINLENSE